MIQSNQKFEDFARDIRIEIEKINVLRKSGFESSQTGFLTLLIRCLFVGVKNKKFEYPRDREKNLRSIMNEQMPGDDVLLSKRIADAVEQETIDSVQLCEQELNKCFNDEEFSFPIIRQPFKKHILVIQSLIDYYEQYCSNFTEIERLVLIGCEQLIMQYEHGMLRCSVVSNLFTELNEQILLREKYKTQSLN